MKTILNFLVVMGGLLLSVSCNTNSERNTNSVRFIEDIDNKAVEVYFGENYFTSFLYPDNMEKQVLYPIITASGKEITRGYPINPRPFERTDHPHHVGLWFNFGDVNGHDFWNNSFAVKAEDKHRYGSIRFKEIIDADPKSGSLTTASEWINNEGEVLLEETSTYIFEEHNGARSITRAIELTARTDVIFTENKEGMLGLRVDRTFEEPASSPGRFLDSEGNVTETPILNNEGVNGEYRNAEGLSGGEVWGKRSPWVALRAEKEGEIITIVVFDHPDNPNYPAWSHARGYGLFATNNLGGRAFDKNAEPVTLKLNPGEKILFTYKVLIGGDISDQEISRISDGF